MFLLRGCFANSHRPFGSIEPVDESPATRLLSVDAAPCNHASVLPWDVYTFISRVRFKLIEPFIVTLFLLTLARLQPRISPRPPYVYGLTYVYFCFCFCFCLF